LGVACPPAFKDFAKELGRLVPKKRHEIWHRGKRVAKWTWRNFSPERLSARQSYLGKKGNEKRWADHVAESTTKPWDALGISRRMYYYRKKAGVLA